MRILCPRVDGDEQIRWQDKRGLRRQAAMRQSVLHVRACAGHKNGTRQRSDVIAVRSGEAAVQAASRS